VQNCAVHGSPSLLLALGERSSVRSLFAALILFWMILSALMRRQAPSSVSRAKKVVFICSHHTTAPSSNRYELLDLYDLRVISEGKGNLLNTMLRQSLFQQADML
jgi:hypothetical protein